MRWSTTFLMATIVAGCQAQPPVVTQAEFERIQPGMTYDEVVEIIGDPGVETARLVQPAVKTRNPISGKRMLVMERIEMVSYSWQNADGSNMSCTFHNGRLDIKAQALLPD